eukprot:scaffold4855_cov115-Isochrysis_galbana.AAC.5
MAEGRRARAQRLALNMANLLRTSTYNCYFYLLDVNTESDSDLSFAVCLVPGDRGVRVLREALA